MEWIDKEKVAPSWLGFLSARCSKCGKYVCTSTVNNEYFQYKYCPHCGFPVGTKEETDGNPKDMVEIVRCRNCKHHLDCAYWLENGDDWFCANGKKGGEAE